MEVVLPGASVPHEPDEHVRKLDDEISKTFDKCRDRVKKIAETSGRFEFKEDIQIDDISGLLRASPSKASKQGSPTALGKAEDCLNRTLNCIMILGGIVAGGLTYAVGEPANTCYNALTFVIKAYQDYKGIFEKLTELLSKCADFFDRLIDFWKPEVDMALKRLVCDQLELFVQICDHTIELRKTKLFRMKTFFKITFLGEDQVQTLLNKMDDASKRENLKLAASNYGRTIKIEATTNRVEKIVTNMSSDQNQDRAETRMNKQKRKWETNLIRRLGWQDDALGTNLDGNMKVPKPVWEARLSQHMEPVRDENIDWLISNKLFKKWIDGSNDDLPVLGIRGSEGTGKTVLAARIIKYLQTLGNLGRQGPRSFVAYYFVETDSKTNSAAKTGMEARVSRSLLWQFADSYLPFLKLADRICASTGITSHHSKMWDTLLFNEERAQMDVTFFIVIDGLVNHTHAEFLRDLLEPLQRMDGSKQRIRMLITGDSVFFDFLKEVDVTLPQAIILGDDNSVDVENYITDRAKRISEDGWTRLSSRVRTNFIKKLQTSTGGDYRKISLALADISEQGRMETAYIQDWLKRARNTAFHPISTTIQRLSKIVTIQDASDINEIILWVISGRVWLDTNHMDGALSLRDRTPLVLASSTDEGTMDDASNSHRSAKFLIRNQKYSLFEVNGRNQVDFKDGATTRDAMRYVPVRKRAVGGRTIGGLASDEENKYVQQNEVDMVERYLKTVCTTHLYDKFGFKEFFKQKLAWRDDCIFRDPKNSELILSLRCLVCLVGTRIGKSQLLHAYAAAYLYEHLNWVIYEPDEHESDESESESSDENTQNDRLSSTNRDLRKQVGILLVKLFSEGYAIDSLFGIKHPFENERQSSLTLRQLPSTWSTWIIENTGVDLLTRYFKDPEVLKSIAEHYLVRGFTGTALHKLEALLSPAVKRAVAHLLEGDATSYQAESAFLFLLVVEAKLSSRDVQTEEKQLQYFWSPAIEHIEAVETWALNLASEKRTTDWEANMSNVLLCLHIKDEKTITKRHVEERASKAIGDGTKNWLPIYVLAQVNEPNDETFRKFDEITNRFSASINGLSITPNKKTRAEIYLKQGDKYWQHGPSNQEYQRKAVNAYLASIKEDASHHQYYVEIIEHLGEKDLWEDIVSLIDALVRGPSRDRRNHKTPIGQTALLGIDSEEFTTSLKKAVQRHQRWDLLKTVYEAALEEDTSNSIGFWIRQKYGNALARHPDENEQLRVWEDLSREKVPAHLDYLRSAIFRLAVKKLMPIYTRRVLPTTSGDSGRRTGAAVALNPTFVKSIRYLYDSFQASPCALDLEQGLYFARHYARIGNVRQAKKLAKELVLQSLEMMTNDDPGDDHQCFWQLQTVFCTFGDCKNATAAINMMAVTNKAEYCNKMKQWEKDNETWRIQNQTITNDGVAGSINAADQSSKNNTSASNALEPEPSRPSLIDSIGAFCDVCKTDLKVPSNIYLCMDDCGQVQLHKECYEALKAGTAETDECHQDHEFFHTQEQNAEDVMKVELGHVFLDGKVIILEQWKAQIRAEYVDCDESADGGQV